MIYSEIRLKWYHPAFNIGMADLKSAWLLNEEPIALIVTVYRGRLTYRIPKTRKRISYAQIKDGLVKTARTIQQPSNTLPF